MESNLERLRKDLGKGAPLPLKKQGDQQPPPPVVKPHPPGVELRLGGGAQGEDTSEDSDDQVEAMAEGMHVHELLYMMYICIIVM